ncbi:caspase recruitment domain-containing protein 19-like isoform X2 [Hypomesus transpacificus]|uniref:caspase recruitment domain-containing protein 19-like isoform X2 n=1 Tax=Hypomesus transpacificus TaxID=137520 RepID=UPI001F083395|nr:caspase recruitment domain-containing protein 19-like isoform X2 [Hypomesus transpacificus]
MGDTFHDQLLEDSRFLKSDRRLDTELVDKLILQLNRIYPQILSDKEATKGRGEEACREFYRALHLHVEEVYYSLPTRLRLRDDPFSVPLVKSNQRYALNDKGPLFFLGCFSVAVGMAMLYYYGESRVTGGSRALGLVALGLGRTAREVLIWYSEDNISM